MCDCASYNRPDLGGGVPPVVLTLPPHMEYEGRKTVCVDACIAPVIKILWDAEVVTLGCCCGHNGVWSRCVIVDPDHAKRARALAPNDVDIQAWRLVSEPSPERNGK